MYPQTDDRWAHFELVTAAQRLVLAAIPLRVPEAGEALETFIATAASLPVLAGSEGVFGFRVEGP